MSDPYAAHARFIQPAGPLRGIWRVALMVALIETVFILTPLLVSLLIPTQAGIDAYVAGTGAAGTLAQFFAFAIPALALTALLQPLHQRGFWSLVGDRQAALRDLWRVAVFVAVMLALIELTPPWISLAGAQMRDPAIWLALLPVALLALLVQVGTEELFFRGYLQQQLASLSRARWVWMGVPSLLFGSLHYWNGTSPAQGAIWVFWATLVGLACADLTARTGNLGAAVGLHLANNAFALLLYGTMGAAGSGLALFLFPDADPAPLDLGLDTLLTPWVFVDLGVTAFSVYVMWGAARLAIRR